MISCEDIGNLGSSGTPPITVRVKQSRWKKTDVDQLFNVNSIDGFYLLEELTDYHEDELQDLIHRPKRKRKRKHADEAEDISESNNGLCEKVDAVTDTAQISSPCECQPILKQHKADVAPQLVEPLTKAQKKRIAFKDKQRKKKLMKLKEKMKLRKNLRAGAALYPAGERNVTASPASEIQTSPKLSVAATRPASTSRSPVGSALGSADAIIDGPAPKFSSDVTDWLGLEVPEAILRALSEKKFKSPTPIQKLALPPAISHRRDIIGAAETGSGKTLAFGIPLVTLISSLKAKNANVDSATVPRKNGENALLGLVLAPTRELAIQVHEHIRAAARYTEVKCIVIVGGMAAVKQQRLLAERPDIVVATPGRLHKLMMDGELYLSRLEGLKFLVIDECDRMLERGHFKELTEILSRVNSVAMKVQKFVFSATLTLPQHHAKRGRDKKKKPVSDLQALIDAVGLNPKAKVIDLTTKSVTAALLKQKKVVCTNEEKDLYLFYFLLTHQGRTIVFANSISCTKKLCALYTLLGYEPLLLHAGKQQRQRLKTLDRFVERENGLLIATDVASRGLDVPKVRYVVHYQLPVDPKVYIHRSGRTARAQELGLSLILEGPEDYHAYQKISRVMKLERDIEPLTVDGSFLEAIKVRVQLAKRIEKEEFKVRKTNSETSWKKRAAKSLDIEMDETNEEAPVMTKQQRRVVSQMKLELAKLLKSDIYPKGFSGSYPTRLGSLKLPGLRTNNK